MKLAPNSVEFGNLISIVLRMDLARNLEENEQVLYAKNTKIRQHHKYSAQTLRSLATVTRLAVGDPSRRGPRIRVELVELIRN